MWQILINKPGTGGAGIMIEGFTWEDDICPQHDGCEEADHEEEKEEEFHIQSKQQIEMPQVEPELESITE